MFSLLCCARDDAQPDMIPTVAAHKPALKRAKSSEGIDVTTLLAFPNFQNKSLEYAPPPLKAPKMSRKNSIEIYQDGTLEKISSTAKNVKLINCKVQKTVTFADVTGNPFRGKIELYGNSKIGDEEATRKNADVIRKDAEN